VVFTPSSEKKGKDVKCSDFTILFAEDDLGIQKTYQSNFVKEGYHILMAEHGAGVMAELNEQKVDLLVTDMEMPGMNRLEFFPILKKDYPRLPVIVVSGHYADKQNDFINKGFDIKAFFQKPVTGSELKEKVREILKIDRK
jgi:DNA-binding NtrC family response regulator